MSNKKILEEATIRRFMKLASIDTLSENFLDTVQEEEQVEAIKKWWNENGKSIIAGIIIGITAIFGWRGYENHTAMQAKAASMLYEQLLVASRKNDADNMRRFANSIIADYGSSTYAVFSKLMLAKIESEQSNFENAEAYLSSILDNNLRDEFKHIVRLRLVRVLIANNKLDSAEKILSKIESKLPDFTRPSI